MAVILGVVDVVLVAVVIATLVEVVVMAEWGSSAKMTALGAASGLDAPSGVLGERSRGVEAADASEAAHDCCCGEDGPKISTSLVWSPTA